MSNTSYGGSPDHQSSQQYRFRRLGALVFVGALAILNVARTRLFELAILCWSLLFGFVILTLFQVTRPPWLVRKAVRLWSAGFVFAARWIVGVRYTIEGRENIPDHPVIFVSNHQSYWESIALTALLPDVNILTKVEAMDIPVFGWGLRYAPMIKVHRGRPRTNLGRIIREVKRSIADGRSILIFPEGTRVEPGCTLPYKAGLNLIYAGAKVPVVPIAHNAGLLWTKGFAAKVPGHVTLRFCQPIPAGWCPDLLATEIETMINREKDLLLHSSIVAKSRN